MRTKGSNFQKGWPGVCQAPGKHVPLGDVVNLMGGRSGEAGAPGTGTGWLSAWRLGAQLRQGGHALPALLRDSWLLAPLESAGASGHRPASTRCLPLRLVVTGWGFGWPGWHQPGPWRGQLGLGHPTGSATSRDQIEAARGPTLCVGVGGEVGGECVETLCTSVHL